MKYFLIGSCVFILGLPGIGFADSYMVIVNQGEKAEVLTADSAKLYLLEKAPKWSNGKDLKLVIVNPSTDNAINTALVNQVFNKTPSNYAKELRIQEASGAPPHAEVDDFAKVAETVGSTEGAIGIVPSGTTLPAGAVSALTL